MTDSPRPAANASPLSAGADAALSAASLSALDQSAFTAHLAAIYEHSPWIAERSWPQRPFASRAALARAMEQTLDAASADEQLALLRAHPELAGQAARRGELGDDSRREQAGARLGDYLPDELATIDRLNREYREKFGFPFIVAVKGLTRGEILAAMARRVGHERDQEFAEALAQVKRIAGFRLADKVAD